MSANPVELKAALRRQLRAAAQKASPAVRAAASDQLRARLQQQPCWRDARSVLLYFPLSDEPDIWPLAAAALAAGKSVALPRHSPDHDRYLAAQITDATADLRPGWFGVREPVPECPIFPLNRLDLTLVPGVGFTFGGRRLGRGKGYYDRLLAEVSGFKCGVAFDWQMADEVPAEPHDVVLNCILTPSQWREVARRAVLK